MIENERTGRPERLLQVARRMLTAARTAPKAKGMDNLECCLVSGDDLEPLRQKMLELHTQTGRPVFLRDSHALEVADAVVLIGTRAHVAGLDCGRCGSPECGQKPAEVPCVFNCTDVGIALGSAAATAADARVDTRTMWSVGTAAALLGLPCPGCTQVYALPLSSTSKNPFFDRH